MNDKRAIFVAIGLLAIVSIATAEAISLSERTGVSTPKEQMQLQPTNSARICPSDALPPIDAEATLQAVIDTTFEGTYSGEACWLDPELLHRAFARQQTERSTPIQ